MKLSSDDLKFIYPDSLVIPVSESERQEAWKKTQIDYDINPVVRQNAYINYLCLNLFLNYLTTELNVKISSSQTNIIFSFWQLVNGTGIDLEDTRIILIPREKNHEDLRVPREWLDLADWVGNYYLAVELDLEQNWLQIFGYATYQQLRENGDYDLIDETYSLPVEELIEDLTVMWTAREILPCKRPQLENSFTLTTEEAELLLENFNQPLYCLPRLELPFNQWGALLATAKWRQKLLQQLQETKVATIEKKAIAETIINLNQWFEATFIAGWQSLESALNLESKNLAFNFRKNSTAASNVSVKGVKLFDLDLQQEKRVIALLIELNVTVSKTISLGVQLHPVGEQTYLPEGIKIALIAPEGDILQQSVARKSDRFIQLKRFSCPSGQNFSLRIELEDYSLQEDFVT